VPLITRLFTKRWIAATSGALADAGPR